MSNDLKTIKPIDIGGVAGGEKFICQGILFKFAIDSAGLYQGDENAMKSASHDLKGLMNYYHCGIKELHFPLMAYIDYRGFRLVAVSLLPISSKTIIYGSSDAGRTVHSSDEHFNELMKTTGNLLNVKGHKVGVDSTVVYGAADIEGHLGVDGKYYLLDFARVAPPQPPQKRENNYINCLEWNLFENILFHFVLMVLVGFLVLIIKIIVQKLEMHINTILLMLSPN